MLEIIGLKTGLIGPFDLSLRAGEIAVLRGASGSGKSLFLRAIADLDLNEAVVLLNTRSRSDFDAPDWRRQVAFVPAESGWWADKVSDHFGATPNPREMLAALDLPDALNWQVSRLSTGEKQRLALVRSLQLSPQVLLLDEPTSALDEDNVAKVEALIKAQAQNGCAVLLVSHELAQGARLGDVFYRLEAGRIMVDA